MRIFSYYETFKKYTKSSGVISNYMSFYPYVSYTLPGHTELSTTCKEADDIQMLEIRYKFKSPDEFDYENYLFNLTETIKCPEIERAFSDHLDDTDEDVLYHVMQTYRERAVRSQFDGNPSKFWEYDKKVVIPKKLIEVGDFYGTTDRLIFLWEDCWDI